MDASDDQNNQSCDSTKRDGCSSWCCMKGIKSHEQKFLKSDFQIFKLSASTDDDEKMETSNDKNVEEAAVDLESDVYTKRKGCSSWCCMKGIESHI